MAGPDDAPGDTPPVAGPPPEVIVARRDFLACARARRANAPAFLLQARDRRDDAPPRVGYTCSKKVGNAVARNRAKRRLREAARAVIPRAGRAGWDYVLIGFPESTAARPFRLLLEDLTAATARVHEARPPRKKRP